MFIVTLTDPKTAKLLSEDIEKLQALLVDFKALRVGVYPSRGTLSAAPFLNEYRVINRVIDALWGDVTGHPTVSGNNEPMISSPLFVVLKDIVVAWTLFRWYRLQEVRIRLQRAGRVTDRHHWSLRFLRIGISAILVIDTG